MTARFLWHRFVCRIQRYALRLTDKLGERAL